MLKTRSGCCVFSPRHVLSHCAPRSAPLGGALLRPISSSLAPPSSDSKQGSLHTLASETSPSLVAAHATDLLLSAHLNLLTNLPPPSPSPPTNFLLISPPTLPRIPETSPPRRPRDAAVTDPRARAAHRTPTHTSAEAHSTPSLCVTSTALALGRVRGTCGSSSSKCSSSKSSD